MSVILGSNDMFGVPFPLVVGDRFFHVYEEYGAKKIDIFRWDERDKQPVYEVKESQPLRGNIDTNPTGIVTIGDEGTGRFLYKFRPKPGVSQIFGRIPVDQELTVIIADDEIRVMDGTREICSFQNNQITGCPIGIQVGVDGSIGMGVGGLPEGMTLARRS